MVITAALMTEVITNTDTNSGRYIRPETATGSGVTTGMSINADWKAKTLRENKMDQVLSKEG
jgi:hypothetical protein